MSFVCTEYFSRVDEAFRREKHVQGWSRAKRRALIAEETGSPRRLSKKTFERRTTTERDELSTRRS